MCLQVTLPNGRVLRFEVRFGANAVSAKFPTQSHTGILQVNLDDNNSRVVVPLDDAAASAPSPAPSPPFTLPPGQQQRYTPPAPALVPSPVHGFTSPPQTTMVRPVAGGGMALSWGRAPTETVPTWLARIGQPLDAPPTIWLKAIGLETLAQMFAIQSYDQMELLVDMEDEDIDDLCGGVNDPAQRGALTLAMQQLKGGGPSLGAAAGTPPSQQMAPRTVPAAQSAQAQAQAQAQPLTREREESIDAWLSRIGQQMTASPTAWLKAIGLDGYAEAFKQAGVSSRARIRRRCA